MEAVEDVEVAEAVEEVAANVIILSQFILFKPPHRYFHCD